MNTCSNVVNEGESQVSSEEEEAVETEEQAQAEAAKTHYVYVIHSGNDRTYTGYTINPARRLRQHRGELAGGARSTAGRHDWRFLTLTTCPTWDHRRALQVEWKTKHPDGKRRSATRYRGVRGRLAALPEIWTRVPDQGIVVQMSSEAYRAFDLMTVPPHVTLIESFTF